ncbi:NAD(P)-binding protein [Chitinimonas sp. BJYL2]|uniref:NAD(P)-binding protein n=1 Tax=Chitinimonas sp. BJYL2 TaxID=2976696 RepID=UPI0022B3E8EE|nr:NAD(P)-binding protein [Chitinimonas sp. BJYL2]
MKRRDFLAASALGLLGCTRKSPPVLPPGELLGPSQHLGHRLRDGGGFPAASETRKVDALIVGGGMAGLACGWWLARAGMQDFALLELEAETGGNARAGRNAVSAYPWGAHYLPLPGPEATELRTMLAEFGVLRGDPTALAPEYDERALCFAPQERLYLNGQWQDGLLPQFGISAKDRQQQQAFIARMAELKAGLGRDGRPVFAVPSARGAASEAAQLDRLSMHDWLRQQGFDADSLHWWVNYGCRDDYGTDYRDTSAWAGIHYFAGRRGQAANAESDTVLTWPEGNAWLTRRMAARACPAVQTGAMVWRIESDVRGVTADVWLAAEQRSVRYRAERLVWAAPLGFLPHVWAGIPAAWQAGARQLSYAPWLVANITLADQPEHRGGAPLSWDNVLYDAQGLGYVLANQQSLALHQREAVLTYYRPLSELAPAAARRALRDAPREHWVQGVLAELSRAHPDLPRLVKQVDIWRWGHAMARPLPGLLGGHLDRLREPAGRVMLAHSDLSGFSLAEEAHYWGVRAARWLLGKDWKTA